MKNFKQVATLLFLAGCLMAGLALAHLLQRNRAKPKIAVESKPALLPAVRGLMLPATALRQIGGAGGAAKDHAKIAAILQACARGNINFVMLDQSGEILGPDLEDFMDALHAAGLRGGQLISLDPRGPQTTERWAALGKMVRAGRFDLLAITPANEEEVSTEQWTLSLRKIREAVTAPDFAPQIAFVARRDDVAGVTWWDASDYIGVLGPFMVADQPEPTPHQLQVGWQAQLTEIRSIARGQAKPALLFDVQGGGAPPPNLGNRKTKTHTTQQEIQQHWYAAVLEATKGQNDLAGLFLRLPADQENTDPTGLLTAELLPLLQRHWPPPAATSTAPGTNATTQSEK
ncbi:MAG: hypothetical protein WCI73_13890 [Phycisphaerae bacterium]